MVTYILLCDFNLPANMKYVMQYDKNRILTLLMFLSVCSLFGQTPREIIKRMEDHMKGDASYMEMTMTTVRPRYTRDMSMKIWSKGDDFSLIFVTSPAKDKGVGFLKREKEIWNYLPTIDRMVKMPPSMMSQSWMGSDFTNDDLVRGSSTLDDYTHRMLPSEKLNGIDCFVIELIPKPESAIVYSKVLMWISKDKFLQLKVENFDERMELANSIVQSKITMLGGRELPSVMEMIPADKKGNKTIITVSKIDFNPKIEDSFFSVQNLKKLR
ncbi:MAG: outer membrane lipoprotein-sorting protein [Lentimicrobium sp.]|nr:outer membrane lipoprotein-sorting protein [Lentimicrobium sp.]